MLVHIFRGPGRVFGFTEEETDAKLPSRFAPWSLFKSVEMKCGTPTPGVDVELCLDDIAKHGFHVTDGHARVTDSVL